MTNAASNGNFQPLTEEEAYETLTKMIVTDTITPQGCTMYWGDLEDHPGTLLVIPSAGASYLFYPFESKSNFC